MSSPEKDDSRTLGAVDRLKPTARRRGRAGAGLVAAKHLFGVDAAGITLSDAEADARQELGGAGHLHTHVARFTPSG
jgi:hypothetical protein